MKSRGSGLFSKAKKNTYLLKYKEDSMNHNCDLFDNWKWIIRKSSNFFCNSDTCFFFFYSFLTLQLADASGNPLKLSLSLLPAPQRGDDQIAVHLLAHDQVGSVDVVHLLTDALQAVLQPQHRLPQVTLCHAVELVNGLALGLRHYLGVTIDVGDLLDFDLQSLMQAGEIINGNVLMKAT